MDYSEIAMMPVERVVLLGFMCSGKSSVGESLARRLNWAFVDFDVEIEKREQAPVWEIIDVRGEEYFRGLEADLTHAASQQRFVVMAPGGGWITRPELLEALRPGTLAIRLMVSAPETARRLQEDTINRPLRNDPDATSTIAAMMSDREQLFRLADIAVPAEGRSIEEIAFEIEQVVRTRRSSSGFPT
jgi:shikimate kinase